MSYPRRSSLLSIKMFFVLTFIQYLVIQSCFGLSRWRLKRPSASENSENSFKTKLTDLITRENLWESRLRNHFQVVMGRSKIAQFRSKWPIFGQNSQFTDPGLSWARSARRDNAHFWKGMGPRWHCAYGLPSKAWYFQGRSRRRPHFFGSDPSLSSSGTILSKSRRIGQESHLDKIATGKFFFKYH